MKELAEWFGLGACPDRGGRVPRNTHVGASAELN
jgi:hypothetical protein